jgi:hypothetical protein
VTTAIVVPVLIAHAAGVTLGWGLPLVPGLLLVLAGGALVACGIGLVAWTVSLFATTGEGRWRRGIPHSDSSCADRTPTSGTR